jgi:hypothetical protein
MGWSYRKSFGSGPFRVNFSKSGITYSVGVKGARVNVGPRGTYVNLSSHGITYRKKIAAAGFPAHDEQIPALPEVDQDGQTIASAAIGQLTDTDSREFVTEISRKAAQVSYVNWFGFFPLIIFMAMLVFTSFSSRTIMITPETDSTLVQVNSFVGVNIRQAANPRSAVIKTAAYNQTYLLLDSTNPIWLKVGFNDSSGYVSRRFAGIRHVHHDRQTGNEVYLYNPNAGYILIAGLPFFVWLIIRLKKLDQKRFETELQYDMDEKFHQVYEQFAAHFTAFSRSARIWQHLNAFHTTDYKRNGGAGKLIKRASIRGISANQPPLPYFITNVTIPCIKLNNIEFYFLPERLLVKRNNAFAAVFYKNLHISGVTTCFIEDETVPVDAKITGYTWRYVNKLGGPDRRFNNNRQIPVCAYSEYTLTSDTGIYEILMTSKQGAMDGFAEFLTRVGDLQIKMLM